MQDQKGEPEDFKLKLPAPVSSTKVRQPGDGDVIPLYKGREFLLYFDFLFRFWIYWDSAPSTVAYFSAFGFYVGSHFFIIGTFASLSPSVTATISPTSCGSSTYDWWVGFTYLAGNSAWLIACFLQIVESLNTDYYDRIEAWEAAGREGPKPKYRWFGIRLFQWDWWGALCYEVGVAGYLTASVVYYINLCPGHQLSPLALTILSNYVYLGSGILFLLAGLLYIPVLGSKWILPNILVPFKREHWTSMMWWAVWTYFWGGALFCMSGIFLYWYSPLNLTLSPTAYNIENAIGFGGGSCCFLVGSMLLLMRQSRGRCRPSFSPVANNCDMSVHGGGGGGVAYRPMSKAAELV